MRINRENSPMNQVIGAKPPKMEESESLGEEGGKKRF